MLQHRLPRTTQNLTPKGASDSEIGSRYRIEGGVVIQVGV